MRRTISSHRNKAADHRKGGGIHRPDTKRRCTFMEELMKELNSIKKYIPYNTYRTIKGQMKFGNVEAARTGISRIKKRAEGQKHGHTCN